MKGKQLTIDEIKALKPSDKKYWVERSSGSQFYPDETCILSQDNKFYDKNGNSFSQNSIGLKTGYFKIYEWNEVEEVKTYKTSDLLRIAGEMPETKPHFKEEILYTNMAGVKVYCGRNRLYDASRIHVYEGSFTEEEWTVVKPSPIEVSFMEAVQAKKDCKTVRCEYDGGVYIYKGESSWFADIKQNAICYGEILEGKWFIMEDIE